MEFSQRKILIGIIITIVFLVISFWILYRIFGEKKLELIFPKGGEVLEANKEYEIKWNARNIDKVSIILSKGGEEKEIKIIAKDIPAGQKKYKWKIFVWEEPRQDYKISIYESPWKEGKKISISKEFTILGPKFASCDSLSIENEWPYLPSDYPNLKRVFITKLNYSGNLGGLEGADEICQKEAEEKKLSGKWKALLGDDSKSAKERLDLDGIFVEGEGAEPIPEGKFCYRLLGKNFEEFFKKLEFPAGLPEKIFSKRFLEELKNGVWVGRIEKETKRNCLFVPGIYTLHELPLSYSFTVTCQNWSTDKQVLPNYPPQKGEEIEFPKCYTPEGKTIEAVGLAGLSLNFIEEKKSFSLSSSTFCARGQKLICIEQPEKTQE